MRKKEKVRLELFADRKGKKRIHFLNNLEKRGETNVGTDRKTK